MIKKSDISIVNKIRSIGIKGKRYTILSKRILLNRRGYKVHSPFIYSFIHSIIKNKREYYCYPIVKDKTKYIRKNIFRSTSSNLIYRVSLLELIFRISNDIDIESIIIVSDSNISAVPYYLGVTNKNIISIGSDEYISNVYCNHICIIEEVNTNIVDTIYSNLIQDNTSSIFIISTRNKKIKDKIFSIAGKNRDQFASIELNNLDIWFSDKNITPSRSKIYYK